MILETSIVFQSFVHKKTKKKKLKKANCPFQNEKKRSVKDCHFITLKHTQEPGLVSSSVRYFNKKPLESFSDMCLGLRLQI